MLVAERRRRLGSDEVDDCLRRVRELPVRTDEAPDVETAFALARGHGISLDDALYLELARRSDAHLATLDQALAAAGAAAIPLIEPLPDPIEQFTPAKGLSYTPLPAMVRALHGAST